MKRCKHAVVQLYWRWFGTWIDHRPRLYSYERDGHDAAVCEHCGAWLPLGEANDAPVAVQIEVRAAAIASTVRGDRPSRRYRTPVWIGWYIHRNGKHVAPGGAHELAGYLAREIATHGATP